MSRQKLCISITLLIGICLVAGGCSSQKPAKPEAGFPKEVANRVETEAGKVEGVNKATALVSDKNIYIGLELKEKLDKQKSTTIERSVLDRMIYLEPKYAIGVTSDMDLISKIKGVAQGFAQGNPLSSFQNEIMEIDQGISVKSEALDSTTGTTGIK
ncbi:MAG: YhcN/YlaJ family sporulation lipoprotein [Syntrophomonas sp.]|nr:YhcN/YlaJ family sporulation lipoprotein [Syntrophomonas sp.]